MSLVGSTTDAVAYHTVVALGTMRTAVLNPVEAGDKIVIQGVENPHTGYTWQFATDGPIKLLERTFEADPKAGVQDGNATFVFQVSNAAAPGTSFNIKFANFRPWLGSTWETSDD